MSKPYKDYGDDHIQEVIYAIKADMSKKSAASTYHVPRNSLVLRLLGRHMGQVNDPKVLSVEEGV